MAGFKAACFRSVCFAACRFGETAGFAAVTGLGEAAGFDGAARFGGRLCFDVPLNTSDSQPASLTSIGSNSNATIAVTMVRQLSVFVAV